MTVPYDPNEHASLHALVADLDALLALPMEHEKRLGLAAQRDGLQMRIAAYEQVQAAADSGSVHHLIRALDSTDPEKAADASYLLIGAGTPVVPYLLERLERAEGAAASRIVRTLGRIGTPVDRIVPALLAAVREGRVQRGGGAALADIGAPALPYLIAGLKDDAEAQLLAIIHALRWLGRAAAEATGELLRLLSSERTVVRAAAAQALGEVGTPPERILPALLQACRDSDAAVRAAAVFAVACMDSAPGDVLAELEAALSDSASDVRRAAASGLKRVGVAGGAAIPALQAAMHNEFDEALFDEMEAALDHLYALKFRD